MSAGGDRDRLAVYRPPRSARPLSGCVLADGESTYVFTLSLESAIIAGSVPAILLVGVHNAPGPPGLRSDLRNEEYVPGHNRRRFGAHLRFVTGEVAPRAAKRFGPVEEPWVASGFSSGAAWAIGAAQRRPDVFGAVAGFSAGTVPRPAAARCDLDHTLAWDQGGITCECDLALLCTT